MTPCLSVNQEHVLIRKSRQRSTDQTADRALLTKIQPGFVPARAETRAIDGHSSGTPVAGRLVATYPDSSAETRLRTCIRVPSLFGLAPGGVYHAVAVTGGAVRSYRTLSPLPSANRRRSALCGTFPGVAPAGR